ncbi:DUF3157 family protein [Leptospira neocaledonica]|uniref:DUF3157 domain-containing protein n=1 Tax=Leptospira neocaledonica TaxID=2023192 RepID=A0A2M9ZWK3_9LEPT|nr:DUF3157 family protein [Leptospira neocaledonica]PJZ76430.1 hypothetical protein CH365_13680 [Leptospira neocaledonica]
MKKIKFLILFCAASGILADEVVFTKNGKKVVLKENFTWQYAPEQKVDPSKKSNTNRSILKGTDQTSLIKSKSGVYSVFYNAAQWTSVTENHEFAEFHFVNQARTGNAMVIYEGLEIPLESFPELVLLNVIKTDPDARILNIEDCSVNGVPGKIVTYTAQIKGLRFIFYSFLASGNFGSVQFSTFTLESQFEKEKANFEKVISGFVLN